MQRIALASAAFLLVIVGVPARAAALEEIRPPYLGIMVEPAQPADHGVRIHDVAPQSPAAKAGLKSGDVLNKVDNKDVKDMEGFRRFIMDKKSGDTVSLTIVRDGKEQVLTATLGDRPEPPKPTTPQPEPRRTPVPPTVVRRGAFLGVQTAELNADQRKRLNAQTENGVVVMDVVPNSPADKAGLKRDDIIASMDGIAMRDPIQLHEAVVKAGAGKEVTLQLLRGSEKLSVKATLRENDGRFRDLPGDGFFPMDPDGLWNRNNARVRELERRVDELERQLRALEKKPGR